MRLESGRRPGACEERGCARRWEPRRLAPTWGRKPQRTPRSLEGWTAGRGRGHTQTPLQGSASRKTPEACAGLRGPGTGWLRREEEGGSPDDGSAGIPFQPGRMGSKFVSEEQPHVTFHAHPGLGAKFAPAPTAQCRRPQADLDMAPPPFPYEMHLVKGT